MKTMRPRAATIVAWEKWPDGWRIFAEVICCLGMRYSSMAKPDVNRLGGWFASSHCARPL
jgi:hypothetical protein